MQRQAKSRIKEELGFLLTMIGSILGTSVRLNIDGSYISKSSGLKEATITAGSDLILSCSLILKKIDPLEETELLWTVENRTLLYINDSGFNELVKSKALESANVSFWIPSYTPCPAPCQLADNNTDMMMMCRYGNVSDQVLLHILIPVASSLPWWFYLFPAWIAVIFILVLSNVLSYVFNQRLRLRLSLPPTPYGGSARINDDSNPHLDPCSLLQEARQQRTSPAANKSQHLSPPKEYRGQTF